MSTTRGLAHIFGGRHGFREDSGAAIDKITYATTRPRAKPKTVQVAPRHASHVLPYLDQLSRMHRPLRPPDLAQHRRAAARAAVDRQGAHGGTAAFHPARHIAVHLRHGFRRAAAGAAVRCDRAQKGAPARPLHLCERDHHCHSGELARPLGRLLQGVGVSGPKIATCAMIRDQFRGDAVARVMSFMFTLFILVPMLAPALAQGLIAIAGWRSVSRPISSLRVPSVFGWPCGNRKLCPVEAVR